MFSPDERAESLTDISLQGTPAWLTRSREPARQVLRAGITGTGGFSSRDPHPSQPLDNTFTTSKLGRQTFLFTFKSLETQIAAATDTCAMRSCQPVVVQAVSEGLVKRFLPRFEGHRFFQNETRERNDAIVATKVAKHEIPDYDAFRTLLAFVSS
jgi:hypothetical protein